MLFIPPSDQPVTQKEKKTPGGEKRGPSLFPYFLLRVGNVYYWGIGRWSDWRVRLSIKRQARQLCRQHQPDPWH